MFSNEEIVKNTGFWLDQIQNEIYFELKSYMEKNALNQNALAAELGFSPSYISQVLNGNFNHSLKKLIDLSLSINKVPKIEFIDVSEEKDNLDNLNSVKTIHLYPDDKLIVDQSTIFNKDYKYV